jgi:uncharacterized protein (DUF362 family)
MIVGTTTFPLYNIIVFDDRSVNQMTGAKFRLKDTPGDYRCVTTINDWSNTVRKIHDIDQRFSKVVEQVDYIINVPVLKNHSNAGITFSLKNFFGIIHNPGGMHGDMCDPYISSVYQVVAKKVSLIVGDAIFGDHKNGPTGSASFISKLILIAKDPVAVDLYALNLINTERNKTPSATPPISLQPDPKYPDARHLATAGSNPYSLGKLNYKLVELTL